MSELENVVQTDCPDPCKVITVKDLTDGTVDGNGVFDVMMRSVRQHLIMEHTAGS